LVRHRVPKGSLLAEVLRLTLEGDTGTAAEHGALLGVPERKIHDTREKLRNLARRIAAEMSA
jgi:hypothetical protein